MKNRILIITTLAVFLAMAALLWRTQADLRATINREYASAISTTEKQAALIANQEKEMADIKSKFESVDKHLALTDKMLNSMRAGISRSDANTQASLTMIAQEFGRIRDEMKKATEPNQSLEPTTMAVTPPAAQESRQP